MAATASPRIAVVIPCFNDGDTIVDAVESVGRQGEPVELVLVDDGSTDPRTIELLAAFEEQGVPVVRQPNAGPGAARLAGLRRTTAPYLLPLDADDMLLPGVVGELVAALDANPRAAAAWGWYQRFGDEATLQRTARCLDPWQITYLNDVPATALLRRVALERIGGWRISLGYEDWDLWLSLAEDGWEGIGLPRVVYSYRRDGLRLGHQDLTRHEELLARLVARHPRLWAARRHNWRRSCAPLAVRLALPLIEALPLSSAHKRLLGRAVNELGHGRGVRMLLRRVREQRRAATP